MATLKLQKKTLGESREDPEVKQQLQLVHEPYALLANVETWPQLKQSCELFSLDGHQDAKDKKKDKLKAIKAFNSIARCVRSEHDRLKGLVPQIERSRGTAVETHRQEMVVSNGKATLACVAQQRLDARNVQDVVMAKRQFKISASLPIDSETIGEFLEVELASEAFDREKPC